MAEAERNRVLAGERISRAQIEAAGEPTEDAIREALGVLDHERAAMLAIARARTQPVPVALAGEILPGIELPQIACALIALAAGDRRELLGVLEGRLVPNSKEGAEIEALVLFAAWRAGAPTERIIPELRRLSVRGLSAEGFALIATIAASIDNPNVAAATKHVASFAKEYAKQVQSDERSLNAKPSDVLASIPATVEVSLGGFTVRAAKQVGRNEPCPCGSGLKFKKCCADKPVAAPSPIPGLAWDEFLGSGADRMTGEHVRELALRDLARVDLSRMTDQPLAAAYHRFIDARAWAHAERVLAELERRQPDTGGDVRDELVHALLAARRLARAREHIAKLPAELARYYDLELAIADGHGWQPLLDRALAALRSGDKLEDIELAYALLRAAPPLGIYFMRACIGTLHVDDPDTMLEAVEDARDQLDLPPSDPAWDVLDELTVRDKPEEKADDSEQLRSHLQESSARIDQLERMLAAMRGELESARTQPAAALARKSQAEQPSGLETRVQELEALIREGNAERRDLRQKLQTADAKREEHRARRAPEVRAEPDDAETEAIEPGQRGVVLPRFDRRFSDALGSVPANVAAEAMRTIGTLAAGDALAWRGVKQAKDMVRPLLMARVGIHHRMLFRVDDGALDALDLITRETLLTTLKRLRAAR